jgi:hypothetical protein
LSELLTDSQQLAACTVAMVFLAAGVAKLFILNDFRSNLLLIPYVGLKTSWVIAAVLPVLEIGVALGLFVNSNVARALGLILLAGFLAVVILVRSRKLTIACKCFGALDKSKITNRTAMRCAALAGLIGFSFRMSAPIEMQVFASSAMLLGIATALKLSLENYLRASAWQGSR